MRIVCQQTILRNLMPYLLFLKKQHNKKKCRLLQVIGGALWVNITLDAFYIPVN